jgi:hypothetical protein
MTLGFAIDEMGRVLLLLLLLLLLVLELLVLLLITDDTVFLLLARRFCFLWSEGRGAWSIGEKKKIIRLGWGRLPCWLVTTDNNVLYDNTKTSQNRATNVP